MSAPSHVDVRGTRFAGALTALLATALAILANPWLGAILALILLVGASFGPKWNLWGALYRRLVAPRIAPPSPEHLEPSGPPRFANLLGGIFLGASAISLSVGWILAGQLLAGIVAFLAFLNAAFGVCVGCRLYGLLVLRPAVRAARRA